MSLKLLPNINIDKLSVLKRRRITQKFWRSKNADEIIFVTAPLFFGKTTAVLDAMETLQYKYLHIRFSDFINDPMRFLSFTAERLSGNNNDSFNPPAKSVSEFLEKLNHIKKPEIIIIDDFQLCVSKEVTNAVKSLYKLFCNETVFIIISRRELPGEFADLQCEGKIKRVTENDLAFNEIEIKKLTEQNKLWISMAHTRQLLQQSAGCAGFIAEKLLIGNFYIEPCIPQKFRSCVEYSVSECFSGETVKLLFDLKLLGSISVKLFKNMCADKEAEKQIIRFSRKTGLLNVSEDSIILHPLFKLFFSNIKLTGKNNFREICGQLLALNEYKNALLYAMESGCLEMVRETLRRYLISGSVLSISELERLYRLFDGKDYGEPSDFFLRLYATACGNNDNIDFLITYTKKYPYGKTFLKKFVFTNPYPHENVHDKITCDGKVNRELIKCGRLYFKMEFNEALEILNGLENEYAEDEKFVYYILLIKALQGLYMYRYADGEMRRFREWTAENPSFRHIFERFQTERLIIDGDISAAKEWLSSRTEETASQIYRANVEYFITDALCYVAVGESDAALLQLKDVMTFSKRANLPRIQIECLTLSALAFQQKQQFRPAIEYMEKALSLAENENQESAIGMFGADIAFLIEKCYWRAKKKGENISAIKKILLQAKNKKNRGSFAFASGKNIPLSERQKQMLIFLNEGFTYIEIAETTGLKITTVRDHIKKLYEKLEVRNSSDAIVKANEKGIL